MSEPKPVHVWTELAAQHWGGLQSDYAVQPTWWDSDQSQAVHVFRVRQTDQPAEGFATDVYSAVYVGNLETNPDGTLFVRDLALTS